MWIERYIKNELQNQRDILNHVHSFWLAIKKIQEILKQGYKTSLQPIV